MNLPATCLTIIVALLPALAAQPSSPFQDISVPAERKVYLGFDRNEYPGDAALPVLRKTFSFSGYWLTAPPRETHNTWTGKKRALDAQGFGFVLLARGREASTLPSAARKMGLRMQDKRRGTQSRKDSRQGRLYFWTSKKAADCHRNFIRTYKLGPMNWCNRDSDLESTAQAYP